MPVLVKKEVLGVYYNVTLDKQDIAHLCGGESIQVWGGTAHIVINMEKE